VKRLVVILALLVANAHAQHFVTLTWSQSITAGILQNKIYRASGSTYALIFTSTHPITFYQDTTVVGGVTYSYRVTGVTAAGETTPTQVQPGLVVVPLDTETAKPKNAKATAQ
jgi:hypothetical protein